MHTPLRMKKVGIENYYHATIMDENVNWMELAHLLSNFSLNLRVRFCTSTIPSTFLIAFLNVHTRERKQYLSLMYIMYADASNATPSYTHVSSYMV